MSSYLLLFFTIPVITGLIGWFTNWAAVKMIFYPQEFIGVWRIGWQGVLPRNALGFAKTVAVTMTGSLLSSRDLLEKVDPKEVEQAIDEQFGAHGEQFVREAAEEFQPGAWDALAPPMRTMVIDQIKAETKSVTADIISRIRDESDEILDLKALVTNELSGHNTAKLVRLFQEIGGRELRFIEYYGGVFGLLIGLVQVAAWSVFHVWWLMPAVGVAVGLVTNWLAIKMIFRPMEPRRFFGVTYQGLFPKRQAQIARDYGRIAKHEILTPRNLFRGVAEGESGKRIAAVVSEILADHLAKVGPMVDPLVPVEVTPELLDTVRDLIIERLAREVETVQPEIEAYIEDKVDVGKMVEDKLATMPKPEFEGILRGLFEKDEWILITIGGALGGGVGFAQAAVVLSLSL